ncbi:MAG: glycosyltransferase [Planctomycetota bacterium]
MSSQLASRLNLLRVLTRPNLGGPTQQAFALQRPLEALGVDTLLVVGECRGGEAAMDPVDHGLEEITFDEALSEPRRTGFCRLPELGRGLAPRRDWSAYRRLRALIDTRRPHLVHTHTSKAGALGRWAARRSVVRPKIVHTFHGLVLRDYASAPLSDLARRVEKFLARRTDLCLAVSESCRDELAELGVTRKAVVVSPAVPTRAIQGRAVARRELGLPVEGVVLGFLGRPAPIKRFECFLELLESERARELSWVGVAAGVREDEVDSGPPNLRVLGPDPEFASKIAALDVLVLPSKREGMPLVAIEAARAGVPVVGFDVPGVRDAVDSTGLGCVVPEQAGVAGLIDGVVRCLGGRSDQRTAPSQLQEFEPRFTAERLRTLYGDLLDRRPSSS